VGESDSFLLQRSVGVPEDHGDVDVPGTEQLQALDRVGIDEVQLDSRVRPGQLGGRLRHEGAEDRLETGQSYPSGTKSHAGGQLDSVAAELNDRPRLCLGDQTPQQAVQRWARQQAQR
jgi:hypothetical protein